MILDDPLWSSLMILNDSQLYLMISNYPYWSVMWWSFVIPLKWSLILSTNLLIPDVKADVGPKVCLGVAQLDNSIRSQQFPFNFTFFTPVLPISWHWNENNLFSISFNQCFQYLWLDVPNQETSNKQCDVYNLDKKNKRRMNYNFNKAINIYAQQWSDPSITSFGVIFI